jgi:hypothetical protein
MNQFNALSEGQAMCGLRVQVILYTDSAAAGTLSGEGSTQTFYYSRENKEQKFQLEQRTLDILRGNKDQGVVVTPPVEQALKDLKTLVSKRDEVSFGKLKQFAGTEYVCTCREDPCKCLFKPKEKPAQICVIPTPTCTCKIGVCDGQCEAARKRVPGSIFSDHPGPSLIFPGIGPSKPLLPAMPAGVGWCGTGMIDPVTLKRKEPSTLVSHTFGAPRDGKVYFEQLEKRRKEKEEADAKFVPGVAPAPKMAFQTHGLTDEQVKTELKEIAKVEAPEGVVFGVQKLCYPPETSNINVD